MKYYTSARTPRTEQGKIREKEEREKAFAARHQRANDEQRGMLYNLPILSPLAPATPEEEEEKRLRAEAEKVVRERMPLPNVMAKYRPSARTPRGPARAAHYDYYSEEGRKQREKNDAEFKAAVNEEVKKMRTQNEEEVCTEQGCFKS